MSSEENPIETVALHSAVFSSIENPIEYICKKHGVMKQGYIAIDFPGHQALYCAQCWGEWLRDNILPLEIREVKPE